MQIPSSVFPEVQEAIQISQTRNTSSATMPTPEGAFTLKIMPDGSFQVAGQDGPITNKQLDMLKICATQLEQKLIRADGVGHTAVCQPIEDTVDYSVKMPPESCVTHPTLDTSNISTNINTSVQVHTPDDVKKKPCYSNFSDEQSNLLEQIAFLSGIKKGEDEVEEQLTLGVSEKLSFEEDQYSSNDGCQQKEFATLEQLPDIPVFQQKAEKLQNVFQHADSFELEEASVDKLLDADPYLQSTIKLELDDSTIFGGKHGNQTVPEALDLGEFSGDFGKENNTSFDAYRNPPPSVGSVMSDYQAVLSPQNMFEAIEESSVCTPQKKAEGRAAQKVPHRRNSKRRTSGGKDLKRLISGLKTPKSSTGKPYPPATASNGRISRLHGDYHESTLHDGWWAMLRKVDSLFLEKVDFQPLKVELLRKYCQNLFAVVLFSPSEWGNNQKRKGIYRLCLKEQYAWDPSVPFCSLNNGPKNKNKKAGTDANDAFHDASEVDSDGDAPRAKKDDLVQMGRYLMARYEREIRPKVMIRTDTNQLIRLAGIQEFDVPTTVPAVAPPPQPQLANTVRNYIAAKVDAVKAEPVIATESSVWNFPVPVSSLPPTTETNSYVAMETETNNTTLDLEAVMDILGEKHILMTSDGEQDFSSLNIQPREQSQMDTDGEMFAYQNPEMKGHVKTAEPTTHFAKVKLEHSYSMTEGEKEAVNQQLPGMTVSHDSTIPGAVLQLAETKAKPSMIQTVSRDQYIVAKMAEICPSEFSRVMEMIDQLNPAGI